MASSDLHIQMLGKFSINYHGQEINTSNSRSRKVWLLLAYLIYYRKKRLSREELSDVLWTRGTLDDDLINPAGALKTTFHRVRTLLNQLDESIGHRLIPLQDGNYTWNPDVEFDFDVDEFDRLVREGESAADDEERLEFCLKAAELYQGDFLPVFATEPWVIPVSTYYHNLYLHAVLNALPILEKSNRLKEAVVLCKKAVKISPYHEGIYQHLMQNLLNLGEQKEVIKVYNDMRQLLFGSFGIMPSDELRSIYREALYTVNHQILSIDQVFAQLKEEETPRGALICDYDFFKTLYHAEARSAARNGELVHLCLLTMKEKKEKELTSRTLDRCMRNLQTVIHDSLRKQDIAARCSESQFVVLLPRIQYRNALLVCDRLQREYARQYPHSPGEITFAVNPPKKI